MPTAISEQQLDNREQVNLVIAHFRQAQKYCSIYEYSPSIMKLTHGRISNVCLLMQYQMRNFNYTRIQNFNNKTNFLLDIV